jgi:hypothetical protein
MTNKKLLLVSYAKQKCSVNSRSSKYQDLDFCISKDLYECDFCLPNDLVFIKKIEYSETVIVIFNISLQLFKCLEIVFVSATLIYKDTCLKRIKLIPKIVN